MKSKGSIPCLLQRAFFDHPPQVVAPELLGKILVHRVGDTCLSGRIIETEAYLGLDDPASHVYGQISDECRAIRAARTRTRLPHLRHPSLPEHFFAHGGSRRRSIDTRSISNRGRRGHVAASWRARKRRCSLADRWSWPRLPSLRDRPVNAQRLGRYSRDVDSLDYRRSLSLRIDVRHGAHRDHEGSRPPSSLRLPTRSVGSARVKTNGRLQQTGCRFDWQQFGTRPQSGNSTLGGTSE
jgi:hypothetical protein